METSGAAFAAVGAGISPACCALPMPGLIHKTNGGSRPTVQFLNCFPTRLSPESDFSNAAAAAAARLTLSSVKKLGPRVLNESDPA